jgi:predicted nucleotidyltransferase
MINSYGLKESDVKNMIAILQKFPEVEETFIFGSRAKGNYQRGSDVDIAVKGRLVDAGIIARIGYWLNEETTMPYHFDLVNYHTIDNKNLISHIDRIGICFYKKKEVEI